MKPYFIVSDLHMGDGSSSDDFKPNKRKFMHFLDHVKHQNGRLVLAGDIFELWQADLQAILKVNSEVVRLLFELQPMIIAGNHDYYLRTFADFDFICYPALHLRLPSGVMRVEHGNEYDPNNDPDRNMQMGKIVASIGGFAENWIHPDIDMAFMDFLGKARQVGNQVWNEIQTPWKKEKKSRKKQSNTSYVNAAARIIEEDETVRWVVFGHTHNAEIRQEARYANTGCWVRENPTFVRVDENRIGLYEFRAADEIRALDEAGFGV